MWTSSSSIQSQWRHPSLLLLLLLVSPAPSVITPYTGLSSRTHWKPSHVMRPKGKDGESLRPPWNHIHWCGCIVLSAGVHGVKEERALGAHSAASCAQQRGLEAQPAAAHGLKTSYVIWILWHFMTVYRTILQSSLFLLSISFFSQFCSIFLSCILFYFVLQFCYVVHLLLWLYFIVDFNLSLHVHFHIFPVKIVKHFEWPLFALKGWLMSQDTTNTIILL